MSMSLRDQLLAAGLINQKQAREAERQQQHLQRGQQQREQQQRGPKRAKQKPGGAAPSVAPQVTAGAGAGAAGVAAAGAAVQWPAAGPVPKNASAQSAKVARDLALNRQQQEKAQKKAIVAQIKQLVDQNRVPRGQSDDRYNFVDGAKIRFVTVDAGVRSRLLSGEVVVVRHAGGYEVVPTDVAQRIRERDPHAVIDVPPAPQGATVDDAYKDFSIPDDLTW